MSGHSTALTPRVVLPAEPREPSRRATAGGIPAAAAPPRRAPALVAWFARRASASVGLLGIVTLLALWEAVPRLELVDPLFFPPFSVVLTALWQGVLHGTLLQDIAASLGRAVPGLALAIAAGVPAGLLLGSSRTLQALFGSVLEVFRNTSALALLPVFTLLMGIGESSKIAMVFYASFWPVLLATINGLHGVDRLWLKAGRSMGLGRFALFTRIVLPAATPSIFTGIRLAASAALLVLVAAEMVGSRAGLGYLMNASELDFDIPTMYAAILALSVIGTVTNFALLRVEKYLMRWKHGA